MAGAVIERQDSDSHIRDSGDIFHGAIIAIPTRGCWGEIAFSVMSRKYLAYR